MTDATPGLRGLPSMRETPTDVSWRRAAVRARGQRRLGLASRRAVVRGLAAAAAALLAFVALTATGGATAGAHAFLVATQPAQGERLAAAPSTVLLQFSEPPAPSSLQVELTTADGEEVALPEPDSQELDVRVDVGELADGIYVVTWEAVSAVDGHGTAGELAFGVGEVEGAVPVAQTAAETSGGGVAASLLFFVGLALASGALALRAVAGPAGDAPGVAGVRLGLLLAIGGAGLRLVAVDGSVWAGLLTIELLAAALLAVGLRRHGWAVALGLTLAGAAVWAARSHAATDHGALGWLVDFVHLAGGSVWAGSLGLVAVWGWRRRRRGQAWLPLVGRYARLAVGLVVLLGVAGVVSAAQLVPTWGDLWGTGYGRLVVVKAGLLTVALAGAAAARWWGLARERAARVRSAMSGEVLAVGAAVVVAALLVNGAPPPSAASTEQLLGPPPLAGEVVRDAGLAGQLNVQVASDGQRLDVGVFGPSETTRGIEVALAVTRPDGSTVDLVPRPCGPGCHTQALDLEPGLSEVQVTATSSDWTGGSYTARLHWPPEGELAPDRLVALVERMRQVPEVSLVETTTSGPGAESTIGPITLSGDRFVDTEPYAGANLDEVRAVDDRLTLYLPGEQILAVLDLDDSGRLSESRIVAPNHEIRRSFSYPDDPG